MIKKLVEAGVHFGHLVSRWCPKMAPYIWGHRNKVHLIDVSKTARQLDKAAKFLESVAAEGKQILWVGTKKPAQDVIVTSARAVAMPFVNHRWIGGTLSNYSQVKKSVTRLVYHEDIIEKAEKFPHYTKKELNTFQKVSERLDKNVGGIRTLRWPIGAVIIVDVRKEAAALKEAVAMGVPVVALVDTNSDPSFVDYVIPANDDATKSISFILEHLVQAVQSGIELFKKESSKKTEGQRVDRADVKKKEVTETEEDLSVVDAKATDKKRVTTRRPKKAASESASLVDVEEIVSEPSIAMPPVNDSLDLSLLSDESDDDLA
jgi:small subunit ribosomal protein S2